MYMHFAAMRPNFNFINIYSTAFQQEINFDFVFSKIWFSMAKIIILPWLIQLLHWLPLQWDSGLFDVFPHLSLSSRQ